MADETTEETVPSCGTCSNFVAGSSSGQGTCRQDSPDVDFKTLNNTGVWPAVGESEWCSEYIEAPPDEPVSGDLEGAGAMSAERGRLAKRRRHASEHKRH